MKKAQWDEDYDDFDTDGKLEALAEYLNLGSIDDVEFNGSTATYRGQSYLVLDDSEREQRIADSIYDQIEFDLQEITGPDAEEAKKYMDTEKMGQDYYESNEKSNDEAFIGPEHKEIGDYHVYKER